MNVASLEDSKQLYDLSGWQTGHIWVFNPMNASYDLVKGQSTMEGSIPAYSAGYLLTQLEKVGVTVSFNGRQWLAWPKKDHFPDPRTHLTLAKKDDVLEDCLALLAIKLFKEGILK